MNTEFARQQMLGQQIRTFEVFDPRVLDVLAEIPREEFVPTAFRHMAFADMPIPLPHGRYMMTPTVEGRLLQMLAIKPVDEGLEIGTGSGFLTACLARLGRTVTSIDIFPDYPEAAALKLKRAGIDNVTLATMDAYRELPTGQFDAIAVTAPCPVFDDHF